MDATDKIEVSLEAQQWNAVIAIMAKSPVPYEVTAPLIAELQRQCNGAQLRNGHGTTVERPAADPQIKLGKKPPLDA